MSEDRAVLVSTRLFGISRSRQRLIEQLRAHGFEVTVAAAGAENHEGSLPDGTSTIDIDVPRGGFGPRAHARAWQQLRAAYRTLQPTLMHHFNIKPMLIGGYAVPRGSAGAVVHTVTGIGRALDGGAVRLALARRLLRDCLDRADAVIFQNPGDRDLFLDMEIVREERAHLILGSGVDLVEFAARMPDAARPSPRFLMVARLLRSKGVLEYIATARAVRERLPGVEFVLGGEWDDAHPDTVSREEIAAAVADGVIRFIDYVRDMPAELAACDVFVLPSQFREGVPRVLLEAAAIGRPAITTDTPGCRDAVVHEVTGLVVEPGNVQELTTAAMRLASDPPLRERLGTAGRAMAEASFDLDSVIAAYLHVYDELGVLR